MKYNKISADVLNEADRFEQRLNFYLFAEEQTRRMFGYNPKVDWVPGEEMYPYPPHCTTCRDIYDEFPENYEGNCVRPMIDEFTDGDRYPWVRCEACGVSWSGPEPCWMCGEERERRFIDSFKEIGHTVYTREVAQGFEATIRLNDDQFRFYAEAMSRQFRLISVSFQRMAARWENAFRGWHAQYVVIDESETLGAADYPIRVPFSVSAPTPPPNVFEQREPSIKLVREVAPALPQPLGWIRRELDLPANWAELRPSVPLPEMPEPRQFEDYRESYPNRMITEMRRRR